MSEKEIFMYGATTRYYNSMSKIIESLFHDDDDDSFFNETRDAKIKQSLMKILESFESSIMFELYKDDIKSGVIKSRKEGLKELGRMIKRDIEKAEVEDLSF